MKMNNPVSHVECCDCQEFMSRYPDKHFELAIVDPDYGLGDKLCVGGGKDNRMQELYLKGSWIDKKPNKNYFDEMFRVSQNQIIWGGNYFSLPPTRGFIIWDKVKFAYNYSQAEFAWTSFDCISRILKYCSNGGFVQKPIDAKIHPTQKPVALYKWLLKNYAKPGDKILDTHMGSGSSRIAAYDMGFDFYGCELDQEYFDASCQRFDRFKAQLKLDFEAA
jgi:site-specific DNA-methyltransferase (adenine-specific)